MIRRLAIPAAIGLFCQTLYNVTDTFFAGLISTQAQAALAFSFPLFFFQLSLCIGLGQALTARIAHALGAKRLSRATLFVGQGIVLAVLISLCMWLLTPMIPSIVLVLGASDETALWAAHYTAIIYWGAPLFLLSFVIKGALQAVGNTTAFRNAVIASIFLNLVLDPLLMFGAWIIPALGVVGIALATLISQLMVLLYLFYALTLTIIARRWRWQYLIPHPSCLRVITRQMVAPTGQMLGESFCFFTVVFFLGRLNNTAVAAYGIALQVEEIIFLPLIGLEIALLAISGQSLSAGRMDQARAVYRLCLRYGIWCAVLGGTFLVVVGPFIIRGFNQDPIVGMHARYYLLAAAATSFFYVVTYMSTALLMAALRVADVIVVSVVRLLILPPMLFYLLAIVAGLGTQGVWWGIFLSNLVPAWWLRRRCLKLFKEGRLLT